MDERAIYIEENSRWYKNGATPLVVRVAARGEKLMPFPSVVADSYFEAFGLLYGHPHIVPPPVRAPRRESIL
jgi:hypothetical protein